MTNKMLNSLNYLLNRESVSILPTLDKFADDIHKRSAPRIGSIILCVECNGCMVERHDFKWLGIVRGFEEQPVGPSIIVRIIKQENLDIRDKEFLREIIPYRCTNLQPLLLGANIWGYFK